MPDPVDLVTIHHQGGGVPSDSTAGVYEGGYTYAIGVTKWTRMRTVWESYATLDFNHVSLDIVFTGQRQPGIPNSPSFPVTDSDMALLQGIITDARALGYVMSNPLVRAHRNSPGSNTVCPGDNTMQRWNQIVSICTGTPAPPTPTPRRPKLFIFRRPLAGQNTFLGNGFTYRWLRSQVELDTYVVITGTDPAKIAVFTDEQVAGMTYVGPPVTGS